MKPSLARFMAALAQIPDLRDYPADMPVSEDMVVSLRHAETQLRYLRLKAEALVTGTAARPCSRCGHPVTGRADRRFCSGRCKQAAYQQRRRSEHAA